MPTAAEACIFSVNRITHTASFYVLEQSLLGSMVIKMYPGGRVNTGITIPNISDKLNHFMMAVIQNEEIRWK